MIYELAEIHVTPGMETAFVTAVEQATPLFTAAKGCRGLSLTRSIETPTLFRLFVRWDTIDDHLVGFRNSDAFAEWRRLAGPSFARPPHVEHLEIAITD